MRKGYKYQLKEVKQNIFQNKIQYYQEKEREHATLLKKSDLINISMSKDITFKIKKFKSFFLLTSNLISRKRNFSQ